MDHYKFLEALQQIEQRRGMRGGIRAQAHPADVEFSAADLHATALVRLREGDLASAGACWERALPLPIDDLELLGAIGDGLREIGTDPATRLEHLRTQSPDQAPSEQHAREAEWLDICLAILREEWTSVLPKLELDYEDRPASMRRGRNLAFVLRRLGQFGRAQCVVAAALTENSAWRQAADCFLSAPAVDLETPEFLPSAIKALRHCGDEKIALELAANAARHNRCDSMTWFKWAETLVDLNRMQEAVDTLNQGASTLDNWWLRLQAGLLIPAVPDSPRTVVEADARAHRFIADLLAMPTPKRTDELKELSAALEPNFYLGYRPQHDRIATRDFGSFSSRIVSAGFPQYSKPLVRADIKYRRIRIGYVTRFAMDHTVSRHFSGWLNHANHADFEVHLFPVKESRDWMNMYLRAQADVCHPSSDDVETIAGMIHTAGIDVLVHLAVGMDPLTYQLAALRLAPVQCVCWGHPVSTGLDAVDYFISADDMEPENGNQHYSERLVTLPGLGAVVSRVPISEGISPRARFGLPEHNPLFVSPQALFKYSPDHDDLFPRIAREAKDAVFAFVEGDMPAWTRTFRRRVEMSFHKFGLNPDDHLLILPQRDLDEFLLMLRCCDAMLDTIDWSGGQTTYDALNSGLPIVTLPGKMMRGRQSCAMLRKIGVEDTIASDLDDYVRIAVRLGQDAAWRDGLRRRVRERNHLLFDDTRPVKALEAFYRWAANAARPGDEALFKLWPVTGAFGD